jgi:predicted lipoprotein with Yx(FWY)xxD motif
MQRKQLTLVIVSLLVVVLSVSLAYFTAQIIGKGKDVSVTSANLQIVFTDSDGALTETDIEPGWSATKTFTIKNDTKTEYKYNIVIKDLLNTFVTEGYLQYKITSTNDGYNMTEFKDIPKSSTPKDTILAYSVVIPNGVTQSYTIEFKYTNDENIDQSDDMGKQLSGTLFITEGTELTFLTQLLADKSTRLTRTDFSKVLTDNNTNTLYTSTEDSKTVYYFAGNATDNWVKFGKNANNQDLYWRIIRTNSEGSIRLLYHGTSTTATNAYIGTIKFNSTYNDAMYVGYMYGTSGSQVNNRTNTNSSTIKGVIDTWYKDNLNSNYGKYLSATAIYCNDRSVTSGTYSVSSSFGYSAKTRLDVNKTPTYNCADTNDKFTADTSTGNGKLTYPIALMTADEVSFAGGKYGSNAPTWYYYNSANESSTGSTWWWVLSPYIWDGSYAHVFGVHGSSWPGLLNSNLVLDTGGVRPVTSLKSCVKYSSGDGTATNPYTIQETTSGC